MTKGSASFKYSWCVYEIWGANGQEWRKKSHGNHDTPKKCDDDAMLFGEICVYASEKYWNNFVMFLQLQMCGICYLMFLESMDFSQ